MIHLLREERDSLLRRIEGRAGRPGINDLRARLRIVTTKLLREELNDG